MYETVSFIMELMVFSQPTKWLQMVTLTALWLETK
ncbi:hypothetical protein [Vibrio phage VCPH]|nr:hypothetical protein [Vibrio phage VCPH]